MSSVTMIDGKVRESLHNDIKTKIHGCTFKVSYFQDKTEDWPYHCNGRILRTPYFTVGLNCQSKYRETGLFRSYTTFSTVIAQVTKIVKLNQVCIYDIPIGHI